MAIVYEIFQTKKIKKTNKVIQTKFIMQVEKKIEIEPRSSVIQEPEPIPEKLLLQSQKDLEDLKNGRGEGEAVIANTQPMSVNIKTELLKTPDPIVVNIEPLESKPDPEVEAKLEPKKENLSQKFLIVNENACSHCRSSFSNYNEPILVIPICKHVFHTQCLQNSRKCTLCDPHSSKLKGKRIPLDHGEDLMLTKQIEQAYGRQGAIISKRDMGENVPDFTFHQKNVLTKGVFDPMKIKNAQFDKTYFVNQGIDFEKLISCGITLQQLYYKCDGIKKLSDLKDIGFKKQTFEAPQNIQIGILTKCYKVDKDTLETMFDIRIEDLIRWEYSPNDLHDLGWNLTNMIESGMNLKMFSRIARIQRNPKSLKKYLRMDKSHFQKMKIKDRHIMEWRWDIEKTKTLLGITPEDSKKWNMDEKKKSMTTPVSASSSQLLQKSSSKPKINSEKKMNPKTTLKIVINTHSNINK